MDSSAIRINGRPSYMYNIDMDELDSAVDNHVIDPPPPVRPGYVLQGETSAYGVGGATYYTSDFADDEVYSDADVASSSASSTAPPSSLTSAFRGSNGSSTASSVSAGVSSSVLPLQAVGTGQRSRTASALPEKSTVWTEMERLVMFRQLQVFQAECEATDRRAMWRRMITTFPNRTLADMQRVVAMMRATESDGPPATGTRGRRFTGPASNTRAAGRRERRGDDE